MDYRNLPDYLKCALKRGTLNLKSECSWVGVVFSAVWSELFPPRCSKVELLEQGVWMGIAPEQWKKGIEKDFFLLFFQLKCWLCGLPRVCSSALVLWAEVGYGLLNLNWCKNITCFAVQLLYNWIMSGTSLQIRNKTKACCFQKVKLARWLRAGKQFSQSSRFLNILSPLVAQSTQRKHSGGGWMRLSGWRGKRAENVRFSVKWEKLEVIRFLFLWASSVPWPCRDRVPECKAVGVYKC